MTTGEIRKKLEGVDATLEEVKKAYVFMVLEECGWDQKKAAKKLGIGRTTLWRWLKRWKV